MLCDGPWWHHTFKYLKKKIQKNTCCAWPLMASQAWPPTAPGPPECHPEPSLCCVVLCFFVICCILHIMLHCASCIVFCSSIDSFYSIEPEQKCTAVHFHMTVHVIQWSALQHSAADHCSPDPTFNKLVSSSPQLIFHGHISFQLAAPASNNSFSSQESFTKYVFHGAHTIVVHDDPPWHWQESDGGWSDEVSEASS